MGRSVNDSRVSVTCIHVICTLAVYKQQHGSFVRAHWQHHVLLEGLAGGQGTAVTPSPDSLQPILLTSLIIIAFLSSSRDACVLTSIDVWPHEQQ